MLRPEFVRRQHQLIVDDLGLLATFRDAEFEALMADPIRHRRILHGAIRSALEQYQAYVESIRRHLGE